MQTLTLAAANRIVETALAYGRSQNMAPLAVAVLDAGGSLVALQREDGAPLLRPQIAMAKAWGAVALGRSSRSLGAIAAERPAFMNAILAMGDGKIVPVPGGVLIRAGGGSLLGAVGVSGDLSERDEACAVAGIQAAGLQPDLD